MSNETAILVLSGKILDAPFPLTSLDAIRAAVEREESARGLAVVRRVATLTRSHFFAAPEFLKAGFEVVPADDEDVQATALLFGALAAPTAPSELLFALGVPEPLELLRALAGRTRRVLLTTADVSPALESNLEGLYDLRALLADDGIDWDALELASWNALPNATPNRDASANAVAPTVAASDDDLCALGPEVGPDAVELDAPAWNAALERFLLENDLASPAYLATEKISNRFPELPHFFLTRREEFRRLLSPQILMIEENSATKLYHKTHPDYRPIASADALVSLNLGAPTTDAPPKRDVDETSNLKRRDNAAPLGAPVDARSFAETADRARFVACQCRWAVERLNLIQNGANFQEEIAPKDHEFEELARQKSANPWPLVRRLAPQEYEEAALCYEIAARAFDLFDRVVETPRDEIDDRLFARIAQATANAQCGLKSVLTRFNVPLAADGTQRAAYELLLKYCGPRGVFLANLRFHDRLSLEETLALADVVDELAQEFAEFQTRAKERRSLEGKVEYHLKKIADAPGSAYDWQKIVEATTALCETFRKPPSSLWFRERLIDFVDQIPEETQTTDAFGRVVQEIDLFRMREEETLSTLFEMSEVEYSPAIQAVRQRYAGARAVFVGGTPQPHLQARLEKKLNVRLVWSETSHGDSLERFSGLLRDEETRLFLIHPLVQPQTFGRIRRANQRREQRLRSTAQRHQSGTDRVGDLPSIPPSAGIATLTSRRSRSFRYVARRCHLVGDAFPLPLPSTRRESPNRRMPLSSNSTQPSIRERLTLAALAEAEAFGFEGFSMRRVAHACGVSCAAPYKHFKNKNELLESVISYINEKWLERQEKTIAKFADAPLRRQLIELSREYVRFMVENPRFLAVWTAKGKTGGVDYLPIKAKTSELSKALLRQYCDEFGVPEETARVKMYVVRSLIYGAALMFCNGDLEYDENALQFVADFVDREFDLA